MALVFKIQLLFILPLILAILICVAITITLLWTQNGKWFQEAEDEILNNEEDHLLRMVQVQADTVNGIFGSIAQDVFFMSGYFKSMKTGELTISDEFSTPAANAHTILESQSDADYPNVDSSVWYMQGQKTIPSSEKSTFDLLNRMEFAYRPLYNSQYRKRFGYSITDQDSGLTYQYPLDKLTYLTNKDYFYDECSSGSEHFDMRCTKTYQELVDDMSKSIVFRRDLEGRILACTRKLGTVICELNDKDDINDSLLEFDDYSIFVASVDGENVLAYDDGSSGNTIENHSLAEALIDDDDLQEDFNEDVLPNFDNDHTELIEYEGDDGNVYLAEKRTKIEIKGADTDEVWEYEYVVGYQIDEDDILSDFNEAKEEIAIIIFIEFGFYGLFLLLTILFAWCITKVIIINLVLPIKTLKGYLDNREIPKNELRYKEFNDISKLFRKLFTLFKFAQPQFFECTDPEKLKENYSEAHDLFEGIQNWRGQAICHNNKGNIFFQQKHYQKAIECYQKAQSCTDELRALVVKEMKVFEEKENQETNEASDLKSNTVTSDLQHELSAIDDLVHRRAMQTVMALEKSVEAYEKEKWNQRRVCWKQILDYRSKVLQYDLTHRRNLIRVIENLIGMSKCFAGLEYLRTGEELIDETIHIISQIELDDISPDINVIRLRRIGIDVHDVRADSAKHFFTHDTKNFGRQIQIQKHHAYYTKGMILRTIDPKTAARAFASAIEKCEFYEDEIRKACFTELLTIFKKNGIKNLELENMLTLYQKTEREFAFLCAYEMFYPSTRVTRTNTCIQDFIANEVSTQKDRIGIYTCYEGPLYQLEMVQRDDPREDIMNFQGKMPKSSTRIMHPYDVLAKCLKLFSPGISAYMMLIIRNIKCIPADVEVTTLYKKLNENNINLFVVVIDNMDDEPDLFELEDLHTLVDAYSDSKGSLYQCGLDDLKDTMSKIMESV